MFENTLALGFHLGPVFVSFYGLGVALAAALWVLLVSRTSKDTVPDAVTLGLFVIPLASVLGHVLYSLARYDLFLWEFGPLFFLSLWRGGFLLWGALLGVALGCLWTANRVKTSWLGLLDRVAVPTLAAVGVLRAFELFSYEGRGLWLDEGSPFCAFPFALQNEYGEWQLAVFVWEAVAALVLLLVLWRYHGTVGNRALLALLCFSACQIVFESLRMDSSPRFGFVRVNQVLFAISLLVSVITRSYRARGKVSAWRRGCLAVLCLTAVGILEWALDKTPLPIPACYALMCLAVGLAIWLGCPRLSQAAQSGNALT